MLQVADLAFDSWDIPSQAMRYIWIGAIAGLPIALLLGWRFNFVGGRIVHTADKDQETDGSLHRADYVILGIAAVAAFAIVGGMAAGIL